jgi:hypothetical protein
MMNLESVLNPLAVLRAVRAKPLQHLLARRMGLRRGR